MQKLNKRSPETIFIKKILNSFLFKVNFGIFVIFLLFCFAPLFDFVKIFVFFLHSVAVVALMGHQCDQKKIAKCL